MEYGIVHTVSILYFIPGRALLYFIFEGNSAGGGGGGLIFGGCISNFVEDGDFNMHKSPKYM